MSSYKMPVNGEPAVRSYGCKCRYDGLGNLVAEIPVQTEERRELLLQSGIFQLRREEEGGWETYLVDTRIRLMAGAGDNPEFSPEHLRYNFETGTFHIVGLTDLSGGVPLNFKENGDLMWRCMAFAPNCHNAEKSRLVKTLLRSYRFPSDFVDADPRILVHLLRDRSTVQMQNRKLGNIEKYLGLGVNLLQSVVGIVDKQSNAFLHSLLRDSRSASLARGLACDLGRVLWFFREIDERYGVSEVLLSSVVEPVYPPPKLPRSKGKGGRPPGHKTVRSSAE